MNVELKPEARQDMAEATAWYEAQRAGLGAEFVAAIDAAVSRISRRPLGYRKIHGDLRIFLVRKFPYAVYYLPADDTIAIYAVMHQRRAPAAWHERIDDDGV